MLGPLQVVWTSVIVEGVVVVTIGLSMEFVCGRRGLVLGLRMKTHLRCSARAVMRMLPHNGAVSWLVLWLPIAFPRTMLLRKGNGR